MKSITVYLVCLSSSLYQYSTASSSQTAFVTLPSAGILPTKRLNVRASNTLHAVSTSEKNSPLEADTDPPKAFDILRDANVIDPITGRTGKALDGTGAGAAVSQKIDPASWLQNTFLNKSTNASGRKTLVVAMPQMGDFDSAEYAELLSAVEDDLKNSNIDLRMIAIGDANSARKFASFNNVNLNNLRIDPEGSLHRELNLHAGPNWDIPGFIPAGILDWFADYVGAKAKGGDNDNDRDVSAIARAWLNYMAMCAGIAAPDTLPEIFRGYVGDKNAPERITSDEVVTIGEKDDPFIAITGVSDVKLGPFQYQQLWKDEAGYQRPVELATVRLRVMVEVLTNFDEYVPDQRFLDRRGATFLFNEDNELLYEHIDSGVLSYSKTMARPLAFLEPYIGKKALNPLGLGDANNTD